MAKYNQKDESKYFGNEFENMPSIDYRYLATDEELDTKNKEIVDWDLVGEICNKHGFSYTIINGTFGKNEKGNFSADCIIYKKVSVTNEQYSEWEKNNEWEKLHAEQNKYEETYKELHNCVHEIDEETELVFATAYAGNVGVFGNIKGESYNPCDYFVDWNQITNNWSPLIHDTNSKLSNGVYIMMSSSHLKKKLA